MKKRKWYLIGDPAIRERANAKLRKIAGNIGVTVAIILAGFACFVVGYLLGLTCFYYG